MSLFIIITLYLVTSILLKNSVDFFSNSSFLDYPTNRSNHNVPKPKCAGLILIPLIIITTLFVFFYEKIVNPIWITTFGFCSILFILSFLDDLKSIDSKIRLGFQFFCVISSLFILNDIQLSDFKLPTIDADLLKNIIIFFSSVFIWVWIINMFNFMDGMDGITVVQLSSFSVITNILAILGLIEINFLFFSLIILAASMAFYGVNRPPAKIFLGDVGSIPIGFLVGFVIVYNLQKSELIVPFLIIIMYYLLDSSITLFLRMLNRENIFQAHSNHFYQKLIRKGYSHQFVLNKIIILNFTLLLLSITSIYWPLISLLISFLITIFFLYFCESRNPK